MPTCQTLNTPDGVLKILHVILGAISLLLIAASYVSYWALDIFLVTISTCLIISSIILVLNCFLSPSLLRSKASKIVGSIFHLVAGTSLILAGIDLIGWSEYDQHCGFKCPRIYCIGVAKILTFMNGTLYAIHGFLSARGEDEEDFLSGESSESHPLLNSMASASAPTIVIYTASPSPNCTEYGSYQEIPEPHPHFSGSGGGGGSVDSFESYPNPRVKSVIN